MMSSKKRPFSSIENKNHFKQTKLSFGGGQPTEVFPEIPKLMDPTQFFEKAIAPLNGTTWLSKLQSELDSPYIKEIFKRLSDEAGKGKVIFPPADLIFNAFRLTPFEKVRVVIIGQDPYHNDGQAHGLSFSVPMGIKQPPSLKNIFKEISKEYPAFKTPKHGSLIKWAEQGVFLLNATLTVEQHLANSHSNFGWQKFSDKVIKTISDELDKVVFLLWGGFAHKKSALVDQSRHVIIKTAHPSPLSYRFFENCGCFNEVNDSLSKMGREPIDWSNI